jgi:hypothetical protein
MCGCFPRVAVALRGLFPLKCAADNCFSDGLGTGIAGCWVVCCFVLLCAVADVCCWVLLYSLAFCKR